MRTDVKIGMVVSLLVVVAAGWYLSGRSGEESELPIAVNPDAMSGLADAYDLPKEPPARAKPPAPRSALHDRKGADRALRQAMDDSESGAANHAHDRSTLAAPASVQDVRLSSSVPDAEKVDGAAERPTTLEHPSGRGDDGSPAFSGAMKDSSLTESAISSGVPDTTAALPPGGGPVVTPGAETDNKGQRRFETHTIQPGETLATVAERFFGDARYAGVLREANPQVVGGHVLPVGMKLRIPDVEEPITSTPKREIRTVDSPRERTAVAPRTYVVKSGDTLIGIARSTLSAGKRWREIYALNKELIGNDPGRLRIGQVLSLPSD